MDMSQYRALFVTESRGHIDAFNTLIVQFEQDSVDADVVHELFRHAHSLKGMAATMQFDAIATLSHRMEDLLGRVRNGDFAPTPALIDLLLEGCDTLGEMIDLTEAGNEASFPATSALINRLVTFDPTTSPPATRPKPSTEPAVLHQPAEASAPAPPHEFRQTDTFKSIRIKTETLDHLVNITGELITTRHRLSDLAHHCPGQGLEEPLGHLAVLLRELRDEVFQARMLPFAVVAERFPRLVRDLARRQGKEINLLMEGREIELDRGILEEIAEPLVHVLRNAVDHGLETPDQRSAAGKDPVGRISLDVTRDKEHVIITVSDDGRGMDPGTLTAKAVEKGLLSADQAATLPREEAFMLVCAAGFSTAAEVSDISGRGVGMDAVRNAVHHLGGTLAIDSEVGAGSRFELKLPVSVSIIHALLVECGKLTLAFPVNALERTLDICREQISGLSGQTIRMAGETELPLKSLNRLLGQPPPQRGATHLPVIVAGNGAARSGYVTDRILGQQEIFVKPLRAPLSRIKAATGGAILGDGRIVFVMDLNSFTLPATQVNHATIQTH